MHAPARRRSTVADMIQVFGFDTRDLINLLGEDSVSKLPLVPAICLTNLRIPDQLWGSQTAECLSATAEEGWVDEKLNCRSRWVRNARRKPSSRLPR
jgi:hypothetical protein